MLVCIMHHSLCRKPIALSPCAGLLKRSPDMLLASSFCQHLSDSSRCMFADVGTIRVLYSTAHDMAHRLVKSTVLSAASSKASSPDVYSRGQRPASAVPASPMSIQVMGFPRCPCYMCIFGQGLSAASCCTHMCCTASPKMMQSILPLLFVTSQTGHQQALFIPAILCMVLTYHPGMMHSLTLQSRAGHRCCSPRPGLQCNVALNHSCHFSRQQREMLMTSLWCLSSLDSAQSKRSRQCLSSNPFSGHASLLNPAQEAAPLAALLIALLRPPSLQMLLHHMSL